MAEQHGEDEKNIEKNVKVLSLIHKMLFIKELKPTISDIIIGTIARKTHNFPPLAPPPFLNVVSLKSNFAINCYCLVLCPQHFLWRIQQH